MVRNHRRQLKAEGLSREDIADDVREYKKKLKEARAELKEKFGDLKGVDQGLISVIGLRDLQNGTHELGRYVNALTKGEQGQEIVYDTTGLRDLQGTERRDARTINRIARGAEQKGIAEHVKDPGFWDRLVENGRKQIPEQSHIVAEDPEQAREARRIANAQMILDVQPGSEVDRKKLINDFKREGYTEEEIRGLYKMAYEMAENDEQKQAVRAAAPKTFRESLVPPPGESQPKQEPKQNEGPAIKRGQGREDFGEQSGGKEPGEQ